MIQSTIREQFTDEELAFLLAFEANETDRVLQKKRNLAYEQQNLQLALRLEEIAFHSQTRLHRRYVKLHLVH